MIEDVRRALRSVVMITVTPFAEDGQVDEPAYREVLARALDAGVPVVTPNGNTSEFYSLDAQECARALELTVREAHGRALVIAGVGHEVRAAARAAVAAAQAGADGVMVHQPVHPFLSAQGWVDYHRAIAEAAPDLPLVCYLRSPHVPVSALARLAEVAPNFVGVKYAVPDPLALGEAVSAIGTERLTWVCGLAESWAPFFWAAGARGFTSGLANVLPELSLRLWRLLEAGESARAMELWHRLKPFEDLRAVRGSADNVSVVKEALAQLGLCRRAVRPPISELDEPGRQRVAGVLGAVTAAAAR
ncbi:dihydrodipicolinate synthase family protein [Kutzneria albida]|uniref:Dihydrodipicolinate synthase n=1 Tax=Kutzneria albida DSM 43870 TaxID=1449976 RepID=W5W8M7_9PSEU|nr:dihydrodipicolinate synthase family protein [Kutzneria albida]AHH96891.1 dihydrodipicolinate synthase [Kutzneria albida DSM 43870]